MVGAKDPKDGKVITASFNGKAKSYFPSLTTTKDLVLLSIQGNEYCSGDYLNAIVQKAVATHETPTDFSGTKGKTTFLIADELYWHNLKQQTPSTQDEIDLKEQAIQLGDVYFKENLVSFLAPLGLTKDQFDTQYPAQTTDQMIATINRLAKEQAKNFEIIRWHAWLHQNGAQDTINTLAGFYNSVDGLRESITQTKSDFVTRHSKAEGNEALWNYRSQGYLTEESPAIMWLAASLGYNFVIYPGKVLPSFMATKAFFVVPKHAPYISEGQSLKDECNHNKYSIHVDKPECLVNWLEVKFTKQSPSKTKELPSGYPNFFSQTTPIKHIQNGMIGALTLEEESKRPMPHLDSVLKGVQIGLSGDQAFMSSSLTEIFAGITKEVLNNKSLTSTQQLEFLTALIQRVANYHHSESLSEGKWPLSMPL